MLSLWAAFVFLFATVSHATAIGTNPGLWVEVCGAQGTYWMHVGVETDPSEPPVDSCALCLTPIAAATHSARLTPTLSARYQTPIPIAVGFWILAPPLDQAAPRAPPSTRLVI